MKVYLVKLLRLMGINKTVKTVSITEEEAIEKYRDIELKIPSIWSDYNAVALELEQDICCLWNIENYELIRVISLVMCESSGHSTLSKHINPLFSIAGLYPHRLEYFINKKL